MRGGAERAADRITGRIGRAERKVDYIHAAADGVIDRVGKIRVGEIAAAIIGAHRQQRGAIGDADSLAAVEIAGHQRTEFAAVRKVGRERVAAGHDVD